MIEAILCLISLIIGYILGWWPYRNRKEATEIVEKHYNDMHELVNAFAMQNADLFNMNRSIPLINEPINEGENESDTDPPDPGLSGGES